jgi:hypothetical protein
MYRAEDWWTYELCFGRGVRQFHKEGDRLVSQFDLGRYAEWESNLDEVHDDGSSAGAGGKFVRQVSSFPVCQCASSVMSCAPLKHTSRRPSGWLS